MRTLPKIHVGLLSSLIAVSALGQTQAADEKDVRAIAAQFQKALRGMVPSVPEGLGK